MSLSVNANGPARRIPHSSHPWTDIGTLWEDRYGDSSSMDGRRTVYVRFGEVERDRIIQQSIRWRRKIEPRAPNYKGPGALLIKLTRRHQNIPLCRALSEETRADKGFV